MTREEWLSIGYQNGIIELDEIEKITFKQAYKEWFVSKTKVNRGSTMDRIECTYNRYYADSAFIDMYTSNITEKEIIAFLNSAVTIRGAVSEKEMERIFQIVRNVMVYMRDLNFKGMKLLDWDVVKRNIPKNKILTEKKSENALSKEVVTKLQYAVLIEDIYPLKKSACLALMLNFYLGLRIGELAALRFSDFDMKKKIVTITRSDSKTYERNEDGTKGALTYKTSDTKTPESHRIIPLLPEAVYFYELIKTHHKVCGYNSPLLVYDGTDTIRIRSLDRTLRRLCALCNIPAFNSHLIRKTFSTMLHHANVPTRVISDLMGHADISTTENSYILSFEDNYPMYYQYMKNGLTYN